MLLAELCLVPRCPATGAHRLWIVLDVDTKYQGQSHPMLAIPIALTPVVFMSPMLVPQGAKK